MTPDICAGPCGAPLPTKSGGHYHERRSTAGENRGRLEQLCCPCTQAAGLTCRMGATIPERKDWIDMATSTKSKRTTKRAAATSREIKRPTKAPRTKVSRGTAKREKPAKSAGISPRVQAALADADKAEKRRDQAAKSGTPAATGLLDPTALKSGQKLTARYQGATYTATVVTGAAGPLGPFAFLVKGKTYKSLSAAGNAITGNSVNGRRFWSAG